MKAIKFCLHKFRSEKPGNIQTTKTGKENPSASLRAVSVLRPDRLRRAFHTDDRPHGMNVPSMKHTPTIATGARFRSLVGTRLPILRGLAWNIFDLSRLRVTSHSYRLGGACDVAEASASLSRSH